MPADGTHRQFEVRDAVREQVPLFVGLVGPSGSGKTFSALRLATGMQRVRPGPIVFIDTENRRGLHYADQFDFQHVDFGEPFGSMDYLAALRFAAALNPAAIIVDSMSHEHEGVGGLIDSHDQELTKLVERAQERGDRRAEWALRESYNMLAWQKPKADRRALLLGITRLNTNVICCYRAAEKVKPQKNDKGKTEIVEQGFTPIAASEFVYEMALCALFRAGARGTPTWESDKPAEHAAIKFPGQFEDMFKAGGPMTEEHGEALAEWARGNAAETPPQDTFDAEKLAKAGDETALLGTYALQTWWEGLPASAQDELRPLLKKRGGWKSIAAEADRAAEQPND